MTLARLLVTLVRLKVARWRLQRRRNAIRRDQI
jgi:hypothetical protein